MQSASLDDEGTGLSAEAIMRLKFPLQLTPLLDRDRITTAAVKLYLSCSASDKEYERTRKIIIELHGCSPDEFPTLYRVKQIVAELTGVESIVHDMCIDSCVGFTGPFGGLAHCPECGKCRYDVVKFAESGGEIRIPRKQFSSISVGPQLQALYRDPKSADAMRYRERRTQEIFDELQQMDGIKPDFHDIFDGSDYLQAVHDGQIKDDDITLMFSVDGAQLYKNKGLDCWIGIWVVLDRSPDTRYKKKNVLPALVIPGPKKPKNLDSFLFPSFHHLAAIQREGLAIWDAFRNKLYKSPPFLVLGCADGPGLAYLNGLIGHHGKNGCRLYCGLKGRHKAGCPHYYPALLKPPDLTVFGCDHPDIDAANLGRCSPETYLANLAHVLKSANDAEYKRR
jgi:hypothetical protein